MARCGSGPSGLDLRLCRRSVGGRAPHRNRAITIAALVPVALAMLFTNQAFPTAGLSGSVVVVRALRKRHVAANPAMGALVVGLMTMYLAYLLAVI